MENPYFFLQYHIFLSNLNCARIDETVGIKSRVNIYYGRFGRNHRREPAVN